jgi:hypothetical protein
MLVIAKPKNGNVSLYYMYGDDNWLISIDEYPSISGRDTEWVIGFDKNIPKTECIYNGVRGRIIEIVMKRRINLVRFQWDTASGPRSKLVSLSTIGPVSPIARYSSHTIIIDEKKVEISDEAYEALKKLFTED